MWRKRIDSATTFSARLHCSATQSPPNPPACSPPAPRRSARTQQQNATKVGSESDNRRTATQSHHRSKSAGSQDSCCMKGERERTMSPNVVTAPNWYARARTSCVHGNKRSKCREMAARSGKASSASNPAGTPIAENHQALGMKARHEMQRRTGQRSQERLAGSAKKSGPLRCA